MWYLERKYMKNKLKLVSAAVLAALMVSPAAAQQQKVAAHGPYVQLDYGVAQPAGQLGNQNLYNLHLGYSLNKFLSAEVYFQNAWMQAYTPQGDFNQKTVGVAGKLSYPLNDVVSAYGKLSLGQMFGDGLAANKSSSTVWGPGAGLDLNTKVWGIHLVGEYNYTRSFDQVMRNAVGNNEFYNNHALTVGVRKAF
jgi:hypothetical protein